MRSILFAGALALAFVLAPRDAFAQYTTIRALSGQASEGFTAPSAGSFVSLGRTSAETQVTFTPGGSVANTPTSVDICIWYLRGSAVRLATKQTILATDISAPASVRIVAHADAFYATACAFSGGSSPTVTLTVTARQVP